MAKLNLNRIEMPRQDPMARARNFDEVALGYTAEQAKEEAGRCIQCKKRNCTMGCPVEVDIPDFIRALREGNIPEAVKILKNKNALPGICGRVCPQESQCESTCTLDKQGAPVAIGRLERFVADWERANKDKLNASIVLPQPTGKKVAIVGSGPAGLSAAYYLRMVGHSVTVFDRMEEAGGLLAYVIPAYRLPKDIVRRTVKMIENTGVEFKLKVEIGRAHV
jgi:glutamate synthase (NADPH/NADH) small chain